MKSPAEVARMCRELREGLEEIESVAELVDTLDVAAVGKLNERFVAQFHRDAQDRTTYLVLDRKGVVVPSVFVEDVVEMNPAGQAKLRHWWDHLKTPHIVEKMQERGEYQ